MANDIVDNSVFRTVVKNLDDAIETTLRGSKSAEAEIIVEYKTNVVKVYEN